LNHTENKSITAGPESSGLFKTGQITGIISGAVSCILWMLTMWDPASVFSFSVASFAVVFAMILLAIIAVIASIKGHSTVLFVTFAISFFPIGLYVIAVPHWLRWVGLANIGYLAAGFLIQRARKYRDSID